MPIAAPAGAAPASYADHSPMASDSEEYEYEEVEIEEEVEVEEEVSDDDVDEDEDEDEDEDVEEEDVEEEEEESAADLSPQPIDEDHQRGKKTLIDGGDMLYDNKAPPQCDSGMISTETRNTFNGSGKEEVTVGDPVVEVINEVNDIPRSEEEAKWKSAQDVNDNQQKQMRSNVPLIRPRSLSSGEETEEGNKRPALICDFFAKGWCIKGKTCRFLHMEEHMKVSDQQQESSVADANQKSERQDVEGSIDDAERSGLAGSTGLRTSAAAPNKSCSSEGIQLQDFKESPRWKNKSEELCKGSPVTIASFNDLGGASRQENLYYHVGVDSSLHGALSSGPFMGSGMRQSNRVSPYETSLGEPGGRRNQFGLHDVTAPAYNFSLHSSSGSPQLTNRVSPSNHNSAKTRTSLLFSSSSLNSDSLGNLKHLDGDTELCASRSGSLQPSVSPFTGSESERLSRTNLSGSPLFSARLAAKFSPSDWEPSKPFRSSFLLSQGLFPGSQYDPIRDSIEPPRFGDELSKFSSSGQGPSVNAHLLRDVNPSLKGTFGIDYSFDRHSLGSHENENDKGMDVSDNAYDLFTSKTGVRGTITTDEEHKITEVKENKLLNHAHARDIRQASEVHVNRDFELQNDEPRRKEIKVDESSQNHKLDFDTQADEAMTKAIKQFRATLIEFVKELLKPTWREGNVSKDAYKVIVKKSVDKVLSTFPAELIPSTQESVDMYLSSSKPKLAKLVEGYIDKYGKS